MSASRFAISSSVNRMIRRVPLIRASHVAASASPRSRFDPLCCRHHRELASDLHRGVRGRCPGRQQHVCLAIELDDLDAALRRGAQVRRDDRSLGGALFVVDRARAVDHDRRVQIGRDLADLARQIDLDPRDVVGAEREPAAERRDPLIAERFVGELVGAAARATRSSRSPKSESASTQVVVDGALVTGRDRCRQHVLPRLGDAEVANVANEARRRRHLEIDQHARRTRCVELEPDAACSARLRARRYSRPTRGAVRRSRHRSRQTWPMHARPHRCVSR